MAEENSSGGNNIPTLQDLMYRSIRVSVSI